MASNNKLEKLPLESALEESPQLQSMLGIYNEDLQALQTYFTTLHHVMKRIVSAHNQLNTAYQDLAKHLKTYNCKKFPADHDSEGDFSATLDKIAGFVSEMSSWEHIVSSQISEGVVHPIAHFIDSDLAELHTLGSLYQNVNTEVEKALTRYGRCKRRDPALELQEASEDVYIGRKKFHQLALHFYSKLNLLHYSRRVFMLEPLLALLSARQSHQSLAQELLTCKQTEEFIATVNATAKSAEADFKQERKENLELIDSIATQSQVMYYPEPPKEIACIPVDSTLSFKSSYLNVHKKYMGVMSSWERHYVYLEASKLMSLPKGEVNAITLLELDPTTVVHATETDDRRYVFQVDSSKRSVILQSLNSIERDEWMMAILNVAQHGGNIKEVKQESHHVGIFSGVGQFLADKLHSATAAIGSSGTITPEDVIPPQRSPSMKLKDSIPKDSPIMFDISSAREKSDKEWFLGSMAINVDSGEKTVYEVMRVILAARAIHNVFSTKELYLCVDKDKLKLIDTATKTVCLNHKLCNISFWTAHNENLKLLGYIVRHSNPGVSVPESTFTCYVYESNIDANEICEALTVGTAAEYIRLTEGPKSEEKRKEETELLLANIAQLPDKASDNTENKEQYADEELEST